MCRYLISPFVSAAVFASALLAPLSQAQSINPNHVYLYKGELVQRSIALGDPTDWNTNLTGREGKSAGGKIEVSPTDFKDKSDAIQIKWSPRKKVVGSFVIAGEAIDLSKFKDSASLTIDMKVDVKPDKDVKVGMSCDYPCLANVSINNMIKSMPFGWKNWRKAKRGVQERKRNNALN